MPDYSNFIQDIKACQDVILCSVGKFTPLIIDLKAIILYFPILVVKQTYGDYFNTSWFKAPDFWSFLKVVIFFCIKIILLQQPEACIPSAA